MNRLRSPLFWIAVLSTVAGLIYLHRLGSSPAYLSIEEVSQSFHALRFADTGRSESGQLLPLFFPERGSGAVRDPVWIYAAAALLRVVPFSATATRLLSAAAGVLDVVLMFLVARELFGRARPAVIAAALLAVMPAHFIQSRIATSQIGTVTCALGWLLFLARYLNRRRPRDLVLATFCLALGMYTYLAAVIVMPLYFVVTLVVIRRSTRRTESATAIRAACAGFGLALGPFLLWHLVHLGEIGGMVAYYSAGEYNRNLGAEGFFGAKAISHLDAWWDCYSPDKLFFSGDPDLRFSTRSAGYFLLAASVPMIVGLRHGWRMLKSETQVVLASGLFIATLPAAVVSNSEIKRWLTFIPFAVLTATCGVEWMLAHRRRFVRAGAVAVLLLAAIQARSFFNEYFGHYRVASAPKFGRNLPGAIHQALSVSGPADCILLDSGIDYLKDEWNLYTLVHGRSDVSARTTWLRSGTAASAPETCGGTTAIATAGDARFASWRPFPISEPDGTVVVAVYRRDAS